jgi:proteasome lid subunit RPN8/RPN11
MSSINFRYLIPEPIYDELIQLAKEGHEDKNRLVSGWMFADRKENFAIVNGYEVTKNPSDAHVRPKSWMRMKKNKIYTMRKLKEEKNLDIAWQFHSHPDSKEELHEVDLKILNYLSTGVMIVITPTNVLGWYFDKRETKKSFIEKMIFEIINE